MTLATWFGIAVAGGAGTAARYAVDRAVAARIAPTWPTGIFLVNVTGALLLGLVVGSTTDASMGEWTFILGGGFLGAYTTFSTWMLDAVRLLERGAWRAAAAYLLLSVVTGPLAAAAGLACTQI